MFLSRSVGLLALCQLVSAAVTPAVRAASSGPAVDTATCNGKKYVYEELAGFGLFPSDARDKFGDTIGGFGSAIALDKASWKRKTGTAEGYDAILYGLPDRGWNTQGTQNSQSRIHKFAVSLDIVNATLAAPAAPNFKISYLDTILLSGPDGTPCTGMWFRSAVESC